MKKNLIVLALLAAAGAASAQSSVTLYGRVDAGIGSFKDSVTPGSDGVTRTKLQSNVLNNSLWGFKGTEDLGNGLKANFVLESGMNMDDGTASVAGQTFNRKATVGLSGDFGTVELGRNYTAYDSLRAATNNTVDTNMAVTNDVWAVGGDYANRTNNSVRFDSNTYSGFSGAVAYAFGENKDLNGTTYTPGRDSTDTLSLHVKYANGPVLVGYAHQALQAATGTDTKYNLVAGTYDFGVAKLSAGYNKAERAGTEDQEYQVGVSAPFGATTVYFGYANAKNETTAGVTVEERSGYDLAATYALSKRTTAYTSFGYVKHDSSIVDGSDERKERTLAVGLQHKF